MVEENAVVVTPELEADLVQTVVDAVREETDGPVRGRIAITIREWFKAQEKK
jgi:hypothetical protein